ncbi:MAG TPA: SusC/RagA family TonB-linked outer membrane protein [Chitinophagaceae bacterium]|jgi:TonB-linked SusC/RagA family outer membrane protein|nr:SusC/RagA family TonB-linked outer membrane protein [Chitinophagaceae bacterium]
MKKKTLLLMYMLVSVVWIYAQTKTVTGKVQDESGVPLANVSVQVKGTRLGAVSAADGTFSLSVPSTAKTLIFSLLNYRTAEQSITTSPLTVKMVAVTDNLSDVVVVAYGTTKKPEITGAMGIVKSKDLENKPFTSVDRALQGAVAGLQSVASSGTPGASQQIRIRGIGSINASSEPLWILDGIPVNIGDASRLTTTANLLSTLNPNDIESITVLKDAASSSVYGSRAANGVILVTTKKGKSGKTKFRFDTEVGYSDIAYFNDQYRPLKANEFFELAREGMVNAGLAPATITANLADWGFGNNVDFNWLDAVTKKGTQRQYNMSASGGNDRTTYNLSGGYFRQEGITLQSDFERWNGNISLVSKATDRLTISTTLNAGFVQQNAPLSGGSFGNPILSSYFLLPSRAARKADGSLNITAPDFGPGSLHNTIATAEMDKRFLKQLSARGGLTLEYKILDNLKFTSRYGIDYNVLEEEQYNNPFHGDGQSVGGRAFVFYTRLFNYTWSNILDYRTSFGKTKAFTASAQVGYEAQDSRTLTSNVAVTGFPATTQLTFPVVAATPTQATATGSDYSFLSAFSSASVNYKNKYVITGSFRRDGSSRFGLNNRYGNFWSIGGTWNIDQEAFMANMKLISQLKLRASYGANGNAGIGNYDWQPTYSYGSNYNQQPGSAPNNIGNIFLTWEINKPFNVGLDLSLMNNRITFTADYYIRKTSSLLLDAPLSRTSGFSTIRDNIGSMQNKGFEFVLNAIPVSTKNFQWSVNINYANNKNKILSLVNNQDIIAGIFIRRVGADYQSFYAPRWAGVNPANGDPLWYKDAEGKETTNSFNDAVRVMLGSASPTYFGSVTNTFKYKGFAVDAQFYYSGGNLVQDAWAGFYMGSGNGSAFNKIFRQYNERWKAPGDNAKLPRYVHGGNRLAQNPSSLYLNKGDYIRLRDITVSYQLPASVASKLKLSSAVFYVRGTNLFTVVRDKQLPWDPEQGVSSQTNLNVFIPKTITAGLNIGF